MSINLLGEWRGDKVRLDYIEENVDFRNVNSIMDVGANTGYFVLSLAHEYNLDAIAYEGNKNHLELIKLITSYYKLNKITQKCLYLDETNINELRESELLIFFNVLHHVGHDFSRSFGLNVTNFKNYAIDFLRKLKNRRNRSLIIRII